jgi:transglutaminase-like putative cysteine protease
MNRLSGKTIVRCLALGAVLALSSVILLRMHQFRSPPPDGHVAIRYILSVENTTNRSITQAGISVNGPVDYTAKQRCRNLQASHPYTVARDDWGNQRLHFQWEIFPPFTTKFITIYSDIQTWKEPQRNRKHDTEVFLRPEPLIESDDGTIKQRAAELKARTSLLTAEKINNWVAGHIDYIGYVARNRGAAYALKQRRGDCTEYAFLFVALCRASGIPARPVAGFVCTHSTVVDFGDYHNWAEFYLDGRWHTADPQNKRFMNIKSHYIAFQIIRPSEGLDGFLINASAGQGLKVKIKPGDLGGTGN